jgi:hypothetical protein
MSDEVIPEKVEALRRFVDDTQELLEKVVPGISTEICESFHSRKAELVPKEFDWEGSWKARLAAAVLDISRPGWWIELCYMLPLSALCQRAHEAIISHEEATTVKAAERNTLSEQRKRRLARGLKRNHTTTIEAIGPKHKGRLTRTVNNPSGIPANNVTNS